LEVLDVGRLAIILAYGGPEGVVSDREDGLSLELYIFLFICGYSVSFFYKLYSLCPLYNTGDAVCATEHSDHLAERLRFF